MSGSPLVAVVAAAMREHKQDGALYWDQTRKRSYLKCKCGKKVRDSADHEEHRAEAVVVAQREAVTITTVEQLDALPVGSSVVTQGVPEEFGEVYGAGTWTKSGDFNRPWFWWAMDFGEFATEIGLPALLIWSPEWVSVDGDPS